MPKVNRSSKVTMQNVWGVDCTSSSKSYKVRFRSDKSSDGWATAFIPKSEDVHVDSTTRKNMYNMVADNENVKVRIRVKTGKSHSEYEVPIRGKIGGEPGFKELYTASRQLVKSDKEKDASLANHAESDREIPVIATPTGLDPFSDEDVYVF